MKKAVLLSIIMFAALLGVGGPSVADDGNRPVVAGDPAAVLGAFRGSAQLKPFDILGEEHAHGLRMTVAQKPKNPWEAGAKLANAGAIASGQGLRISFDIRRVDSAEPGQAMFVFKEGTPPYGKPQVEHMVRPGRGWERVSIPVVTKDAFEPGGAQFEFMLGYQAQTLEIAGFEVVEMTAAELEEARRPPPLTYPGREADAPWRAAAAERIEKHRKGDLVVRVVDAAGNPVPNAQVRVEMKRHAFHFGTAVAAEFLLQDRPDALRYREHLKELFNYATIENHLKMQSWRDGAKKPEHRETALAAARWLRENGFTQRGHTLVWWYEWGKPITMSRDELMAVMREHVTDMTTHPVLTDAILDWDVQNEASHNSPVYNVIGVEGLADLFKLAEQHHSAGRMFVNDAKIESQRVPKHAHHEDFHYKLVTDLLAHGAPVEGIGFQGHHSGNLPTDPVEVLRIFDRFAGFGLPLQITEYDIKTDRVFNGVPYPNTEVEALEADYTRDFMTICFSHPLMDAFILWGFWDGKHWKDSAPVFRKDWSLKPSGQAYKDLVFRDWWTDVTGTTDAQGELAVRGYHGSYEVTVNGTKTVPAHVTRDPSRVTLNLE